MVSWWETVKVEPINALEVWVVNSSQKDFFKALSLMASHALSYPVLAALLACYPAEPLGVSHALWQGSLPQMADFFLSWATLSTNIKSFQHHPRVPVLTFLASWGGTCQGGKSHWLSVRETRAASLSVFLFPFLFVLLSPQKSLKQKWSRLVSAEDLVQCCEDYQLATGKIFPMEKPFSCNMVLSWSWAGKLVLVEQ